MEAAKNWGKGRGAWPTTLLGRPFFTLAMEIVLCREGEPTAVGSKCSEQGSEGLLWLGPLLDHSTALVGWSGPEAGLSQY